MSTGQITDPVRDRIILEHRATKARLQQVLDRAIRRGDKAAQAILETKMARLLV